MHQNFQSREIINSPIEAFNVSEGKLRVLLVISSPIDEVSRINVNREINEIYRSLSLARIKASLIKLNPPTLSHLRSTISRCEFDIVHFIGHGQKRKIQLENEDGTMMWVEAKYLAEIFRNGNIKLVVLNICNSELLGEALGLVKIPAVITTIDRLHSDDSIEISKSIYSNITQGSSPAKVVEIIKSSFKLKYGRDDYINISASGINSKSPIFETHNSFGKPSIYLCTPRNNLPPTSYSREVFFDRVNESQQLYKYLDNSSITAIGITGLGGMGKSIVSLAAAWRYSWRFPDGIIYCSLRHSNTLRLSSMFNGYSWGIDSTPEKDQLELCAFELSKGAYLLIFDDLEEASESAINLICELINRWDNYLGGKAVLVMRKKLPDFDAIIKPAWIKIDDLPYDAALELLQFELGGEDNARAIVGDDFSKIPELCFFHPKLITQTAAALRLPTPWNDIKKGLLKWEGNPTKQMASILETTIDQMIEETPLVGWFLDAWSVFASFAIEDIWKYIVSHDQIIGEITAQDKREALELLQRFNILDRAKDPNDDDKSICYIHPIVSEFLKQTRWDSLSPNKRQIFENNHILFYINSSFIYSRDSFRIERELENINKALKQAEKNNRWDLIYEFCNSYVQAPSDRLIKKGPWDLASLVLTLGIIACEKNENIEGKVSFLYNLGIVEYRRSEYKKSKEAYQKALGLSFSLENENFLIDLYRRLGQVNYRVGSYAEAEEDYLKGLELAEARSDPQRIANLKHQLGKIFYRKNEMETAMEYFEYVLQVRDKLNDRHGVSKTLHEIARIFHAAEKYTEAESYYEKSLKIRKEVDDPVGQQATIHQLGLLAFDQGKLNDAKDYYNECMELSKKLNDRTWIAHNEYRMGSLLWHEGIKDEGIKKVYNAYLTCKRLNLGLRKEIEKWLNSINYKID